MSDARVQGYAQAIFAVAQAEGVLDTVEDELFRFARTVQNETALRDALTDANLPASQRSKMVSELLGAKASPHTVNAIAFLVYQGRARDLVHIAEAFVALAAQARQQVVAEVRVVAPLDEAQRASLKAALESATGKQITLKVLVDPAVVGGLTARVGDLVFDASVRQRLQHVRESFERQ